MHGAERSASVGGRRRGLGWLLAGAGLLGACAGRVGPPPPAAPAAVVVPSTVGPGQDPPTDDAVHDCAATVTEWEVHRCVRRLTPVEQRARPLSNRLHFRGGRLVRHERVNGHGELVDDQKRCAAWDFEYAGDRVRRLLCTDHNGTLQRIEELSPDLADFLWLDAWHRPVRSADTRAVGLRRTLDARGRVTSYTTIDRAGMPTPNASGVTTVEATRDDRGALTEERFLDAAGRPTTSRDGYHRVVMTPNDFGGASERRVYAVDGSPCADANAVHLTRVELDAAGHPIREAWFDVAGEPVVDRESEAWAVSIERNRFGDEIARTYRDPGGRPALTGWGYATRRIEVDERGRRIRWEHFDENGAPTARVEGNHAMTVTFDARGFVASNAFFGVEGAPARLRAGFAAEIMVHDERGNLLSRTFLDERARPVQLPGGHARWEARYDRNALVLERYLGLDGELSATTRLGYSEHRLEYDAQGSLLREQFLDAAGREVIPRSTR